MRAFFGSTAEGGSFVSLSDGRGVIAAVSGGYGDDLLSVFDAVLRNSRRRRSSLKEIAVDRGPGGFSAVRRRVSVATALARSLDAALASTGEMTPEDAAAMPSSAFAAKAAVHPLYAAEPNITISKKKNTWNAH